MEIYPRKFYSLLYIIICNFRYNQITGSQMVTSSFASWIELQQVRKYLLSLHYMDIFICKSQVPCEKVSIFPVRHLRNSVEQVEHIQSLLSLHWFYHLTKCFRIWYLNGRILSFSCEEDPLRFEETSNESIFLRNHLTLIKCIVL